MRCLRLSPLCALLTLGLLAPGLAALAADPAPTPGAPAAAAPAKPVRPKLVAAKQVKGQPTLEEGKRVAVYLWSDDAGFHLRWVNAGQPTLFAGRLDLDKPLKEKTRLLGDVGSGWVELSGDRIVMFSTTLRQGVDGLDLVAPGGSKVQIDLKIDGQDATPEQVFLGAQGGHPEGMPLLITYR
ncbi:MAG TPA: hypothetical protein PK668_00375 [Myxococcota bacterium]|nr:hypothetical protein [Myxococcota bacterium]HRY95714.1 hypothetical protein [Myxococcota bacterium]HSA23095.1 hypothetical protein [Myxococcota bacterium]